MLEDYTNRMRGHRLAGQDIKKQEDDRSGDYDRSDTLDTAIPLVKGRKDKSVRTSCSPIGGPRVMAVTTRRAPETDDGYPHAGT